MKFFKTIILFVAVALVTSSTASASVFTWTAGGQTYNSDVFSFGNYVTGAGYKSATTEYTFRINAAQGTQHSTTVNYEHAGNVVFSGYIHNSISIFKASDWTSLHTWTGNPNPGTVNIQLDSNTDYNLSLYSDFWASQWGEATIHGTMTTSATTPIPAAVWLLGTGLAGIAGLKKKFLA